MRTLTRLVVALALLAATLVGLTSIAAPAQAMDDRECWGWTQHGWEESLDNGDVVYVIEATCLGWIEDPSDDWWTQDEEEPPGPSGTKEDCEALRSQIDDLQRAYDVAVSTVQAARALVAERSAKEGLDHAALQSATAALVAAEQAVTTAESAYAEKHAVDREVEMRNGHARTVTTTYDISTPEGRAVATAQARARAAQEAHARAMAQWGYSSGPALREATYQLTGLELTIGTAPGEIAKLQALLKEHTCR